MDIVKAENTDLGKCADIVFASELGARYYPTRDVLYRQFCEGQQSGDKIYIAKGFNGEISGLVWYQQEGMFHVFPYLHMVAVQNDCKNQGIGKRLMDFFEHESLLGGYNCLRTKVFLTVGEWNQRAVRMYLDRGYQQVGEIAGLYNKRDTEKLYMKIVTASQFR